MKQSGLRDVVEDERLNAVFGWLLAVFLLGTVAESLLDGELLWAGFTATLLVLTLIPSVAYRRFRAMLPWEVVALASLPVIGRALVAGETIGGITFTGRVSTYLSVAAVALIIAVEIDVFTPVRMNYSFAVFFVVIATMAAAGIWAIVQWLSDIYLQTSFLLDDRPPEVVESALMWDFVAATAAGVLGGFVFEYYFRRRTSATRRLPDELEEVL